MPKNCIYLDNAATTKAHPEVVKEMQKYYIEEYGNPSSLHELGEKALEAINSAREKFAKEINAKPHEIYFTSGGTESDNLAIQGLALANPDKKKIIISAIEHAAVNETCSFMEKKGYKIVRIPVDREGLLDLNKLEKTIDKRTLLVSVMHVNNIIGVVQDLEAIGRVCGKKKVLFHTDAVQSFGKLKIDIKKMNLGLLSASAHKIGGPKGIGFLYIREGTKISPIIFGGGQEKNIRSGTENVPAIAGFAKALEVQKKTKIKKIKRLRDKLIYELEKIGAKINSPQDKGIYNLIHASFPGVENDILVEFLSQKKIYISAGSACDSKKEKEDHVLKAIGLNKKEIKGSIRIALENIDEKEIRFIIKEIKKTISKLGYSYGE